jgi:hypothetical protein
MDFNELLLERMDYKQPLRLLSKLDFSNSSALSALSQILSLPYLTLSYLSITGGHELPGSRDYTIQIANITITNFSTQNYVRG